MTKPDLPSSLFRTLPCDLSNEEVWAYSCFILKRNLSKYPFPSKLSDRDSPYLLQELEEGFAKLGLFTSSFSLKEKETSIPLRELIYEHFLIPSELLYPHRHSSVFLAPDSHFFAQFLGNDHLELRLFRPGGGVLEKEYTHLFNIEKKLSLSCEFAFSSRFGYLTSEFCKCGTALNVQTYLHIPGLIHTGQLESTLASCKEDEITFSGIHRKGEESLQELTADFLVIENRYTLGMSEEQILHSVAKATKKLSETEKMVRAYLKEQPSLSLLDLISKSLGLALHSYQLELKEAFSILSLLKLGLSLGFLKGISEEKLRKLFFTCQRGHLLHLFPEQKESDFSHQRALFFKQELNGLTLIT